MFKDYNNEAKLNFLNELKEAFISATEKTHEIINQRIRLLNNERRFSKDIEYKREYEITKEICNLQSSVSLKIGIFLNNLRREFKYRPTINYSKIQNFLLNKKIWLDVCNFKRDFDVPTYINRSDYTFEIAEGGDRFIIYEKELIKMTKEARDIVEYQTKLEEKIGENSQFKTVMYEIAEMKNFANKMQQIEWKQNGLISELTDLCEELEGVN